VGLDSCRAYSGAPSLLAIPPRWAAGGRRRLEAKAGSQELRRQAKAPGPRRTPRLHRLTCGSVWGLVAACIIMCRSLTTVASNVASHGTSARGLHRRPPPECEVPQEAGSARPGPPQALPVVKAQAPVQALPIARQAGVHTLTLSGPTMLAPPSRQGTRLRDHRGKAFSTGRHGSRLG
jgi:hypothetical protein